jgi:hypothetical protein
VAAHRLLPLKHLVYCHVIGGEHGATKEEWPDAGCAPGHHQHIYRRELRTERNARKEEERKSFHLRRMLDSERTG